ncbi:hypothetical protein RND81_03G012100 [Saponaria officinalis]|uniref:Uncharacterized protein n=1 Tax=Saponaria officinalis TaxID=3572 RepID=A0AAW1LXR0_SAPOF
MAVESQKGFFLPYILAFKEDKKSPPNYKPQSTQEVPLKLSLNKISTPNLISRSRNPNYKSSQIENMNLGVSQMEKMNLSVGQMEEQPIKVVRSVVAGVLLKRLCEFPTFPPINTKIIVDHLKRKRLLSPFEKNALLKVGKEDDDEDEILISALNSALLCLLVDNLNGKDKARVYAMSIQPDKLIYELLPVSLHLQDLALSSDKFSDMEEEEEQRRRLRLPL